MVTRILAAAAAAFLAMPASAANLPDWDVTDVCRQDSAPGQCRIFEAQARNAITGSWAVLPTQVQDACIAATSDPADHSWRTLADCIEMEVLRAKAKRTIATMATPTEPEPPAPAATEPTTIEPQTMERAPQPAEMTSGSAEPATTPPAPAAGMAQ